MGYSRNDLGEFGDDGVQRDANGNVVETGVDEKAKAEFQRLLDGPTYRTMPSERDAFFAAGGTLDEKDVDVEATTASGGREDIEKQAKSTSKSDTKSEAK